MSKVGVTLRSDVDVDLIDHMGDDEAIVRAARVSTLGSNLPVEGNSTSRGLINFLMRDRHGTPFEHNSFTFRISAPLFVFHEFQRHRAGWSYNEESGRYRELEPVFYMPGHDRNLRQIGKPGAYTFELGSEDLHYMVEEDAREMAAYAWGMYRSQLAHGVAKEVARNILPVSIYKTMYATCNLRSLFHFLSLRWAHQLSSVPTFPLREIEMVAESLDQQAREKFPVAFEMFDKHGRVAP